ncbi:ATP-binding cassette subfamily B protein [Kineothrix alysoides]|uniref:ATP-binding cassette subfamily B protein n=1 Tax=Kineothrix alysoides TaxID=1469948 RepID=A0A4R1QXS1_9FIRM|nr:ABC transporter ATP-binding protein [Kineothrix alysoides]TCL56190.1 ATP-binding cassette subfamily B protein [Kineothrix alysoides]
MKGNLKLIWQFARNFKSYFILLYFCIITTTFIGSAYPYLFGRLVDEVFYDKNRSVFIQIVFLYGGLFLIGQILHFTLNITWAHLMTRFLFTVRKALFDKTFSLKAKTLYDIQTGDIVKRIRDDTDEFMHFIHWNVLYLSAGVISLLIALGMIFYFNVYIGFVTVTVTPLMTYLTRRFGNKVKVIYTKTRTEDGILQSWLYEILKGMREVVTLAASSRIIFQFAKKYIRIMRYSIETNRIEIISERVGTGVTLAAKMIVYILCGYFIWREQFSVGAFVSIAAYFEIVSAQLTEISQKWVAIQNNMTGVERVRWLLEQESEERYETPLIVTHGVVEFRHVDFAYQPGMDVLRDINIIINNGEKVALVGKSGAGKSTIANLMLAFFQPDNGVIYIDGQNINNVNLESLRRQIGIVWQDALLFDGTIRQNLLIARSDASEGEMDDALQKANLLGYIKSLPHGIDTVVGKGSQGLSGGQKQRLAIARIFLKNPKILIFDEATSSLDAENEEVVKESWNDLAEGRTVLIIAHRLSTISDSDRVAVLAEGHLAACAHHSQLFGNCVEYDELYAAQYNKEVV